MALNWAYNLSRDKRKKNHDNKKVIKTWFQTPKFLFGSIFGREKWWHLHRLIWVKCIPRNEQTFTVSKQKSRGGRNWDFLTTKWFLQRSHIIFIIFPAQVVDLHSWPSSEVNFAVAHQMEFKVQSHVGSSGLLFPALPPAAPPLPSVMPRNKARHAFQHNVSFFVL